MTIKNPNSNGISVLKLATGLLIVPFIFPIFSVPYYGSFWIYELLTGLGLLFLVISISLGYFGIQAANRGEGIKKYGLSAAIIAGLDLLVLGSWGQYGIVTFQFGYYALLISVILLVVSSFMISDVNKLGHQSTSSINYQPNRYTNVQPQSTGYSNQVTSGYSTTTQTNQYTYCQNCGYDIKNSKFCQECGTKA